MRGISWGYPQTPTRGACPSGLPFFSTLLGSLSRSDDFLTELQQLFLRPGIWKP